MIYKAAAGLSLLVSSAWAQSVFVSELHYDNTGADAGEGLDVQKMPGSDFQPGFLGLRSFIILLCQSCLR